MSKSRTYELKRRAERQDETRRRIVAAAVDLHTELGPARTTVKAVAERAGVTRPTVYAHFPDARSLLQACSGHVRTTVPPPDPSAWRAIADPDERLETALRDLYRYYERLEPLLENVQRDAAALPLVAEMNAYRVRYLDEVRDLLLEPWPARGEARADLGRAIGHALEFGTWQSLVRRQGCDNDAAARLMVAFAGAVAPAPAGGTGAATRRS
ncbi:MAG TPA: helix-turn-helix domain-containing protein [Gaiellaceae bacterium]|nr:helix-turn-helix domain-containing protein [Gaiellaceae bacterium]